jgi:hypothetical protein
MKTILKATWNDKKVIVKAAQYYEPDGFNNSVRLKIQVEATWLLPERFIKGAPHKANMDIINTAGGIPNYINKILDTAALREHQRRNQPIKQQLTLDL